MKHSTPREPRLQQVPDGNQSKGERMKRILTLSAILILAATAAFAQFRGPAPSGGPQMMGGPGPNDALVSYLALTSEQQASWQTIQEETRGQIESLREQERTLADQLKTALDGTDAAAVGSLMLQLRAIGRQIDAIRTAADAKFAALLTADQKVKFDAFQAAVAFLGQRGPGGPGPGGRP
jgi:Spy/CpxP family protein refolding chaperone